MTGFPEPPAVGTEADTLLGSLERQRSTFRYKAADLGDDGLSRRLAHSTLTLAGLLKHLAYMEDLNFTSDLAGEPLPAPWADVAADTRSEWAWRSAADDSSVELYRLWDDAVARSRRVIDRALSASGPEGTFHSSNGHEISLRRLLVDMIEEYSRHAGHADLLREGVDGRVGEDPPGHPYPYSSTTSTTEAGPDLL